MDLLKDPFRKLRERSRSRSREPPAPLPDAAEAKSNLSIADQDLDENDGLLLLNPGSSNPTVATGHGPAYVVDIVAIHGLGGGRVRTWRNENGDVWLRDWLPQALPGARIYTYGYASKRTFSKSILNIEDFARGLLTYLHNTRVTPEEQSRPLVFICHSLGGIVCKSALLMARDMHQYESIYERTKAIHFFATPHGGSEIAQWPTIVMDILNSSGHFTRRPAVSSGLLRDIEPSSTYLESVSEKFKYRIQDFDILTFYEGELTLPFKNPIVPKASAFIYNETKIPINANHSRICRFENEQCIGYRNVVEHIKTVLINNSIALQASTDRNATTGSRGSQRQSGWDDDESDILSALDPSGIDCYKCNLPQPLEGTCTWLIGDSTFISWLQQESSSLIWVTGHAGRGKSILANFVVDYLKSNNRIPSVVCYFFFDGNIDDQKTGLAILRSLLAQIFRQRRDLFHYARKVVKRNQLNRLEVLWDLFLALVNDKTAGVTTIVIDAMDECEKSSRNRLLDLIARVLRSANLDQSQLRSRLKLFLTSRREPDMEYKLGSLDAIRLGLDDKDDIDKSIGKYIHEKLKALASRVKLDSLDVSELEQSLQQKAGHTFLWIELVFERMEKSMSQRGGASARDLRQIIQTQPREVNDCYAEILKTIDEEEKPHAIQLLRIITSALRPLTLMELDSAIQILKWHSLTLSNLEKDCRGNFDHALDCLRGLVRVADSRVYLVHQSVREFLTGTSQGFTSDISPDFKILHTTAHLSLADACISYLMMKDFELSIFDGQSTASDALDGVVVGANPVDLASLPDEENDFGFMDLFADTSISQGVERIVKQKGFFDYAALNWAKHLSCCQDIASEELIQKCIQLSTNDETHRQMNWLRYLWYTKTFDPCPEDFDPLIVAAYLRAPKGLATPSWRETEVIIEQQRKSNQLGFKNESSFCSRNSAKE